MNQEPALRHPREPFTTVIRAAFAKKDTELRDAVAKAFTECSPTAPMPPFSRSGSLPDAKVDKLMINGEPAEIKIVVSLAGRGAPTQ